MASTSTPSTRDNFIHAGPACGVNFAELDKKYPKGKMPEKQQKKKRGTPKTREKTRFLEKRVTPTTMVRSYYEGSSDSDNE